MTRLILIRHGESEANVKEIGAGQVDYPLTELGHEQARLAADYLLANERIDAIYSSDLQRAYDTALPVAEALGLPIRTDLRLREMDTGEWAGLSFRLREERYPEEVRKMRADFSHMRFPNGESIAEVYCRMAECVTEIAKENDGKTVLIATHAGALRNYLAFANGYSSEEVHKIRTGGENANIHIHEWEDGRIRIVLSYFNGHLGNAARVTEDEKKV